MLQQTQVRKVVPYYERFVAAFPTVGALAAADLHQVLKLWEGLGYYARARNLHKAAKVIEEQHHGDFPASPEAIRGLPGIGSYTAAAVMSIAFNADVPVVDGNINRVLSRIFAIDIDPKSSQGQKRIREKAELLLAPGRAGIHNQALMEMGAMICTPRSPNCAACPVGRFCQAQLTNAQADYPVRSPKRERPHRHVAVGIVFHGGKLLIDQRRPDGMLGGLWEFPGGKVEDGERCEDAVVREIKEELDVDVQVLNHFATVDHQYTHFTISLHAFVCRLLSGTPRAVGCADWKWVTQDELSQYPFPRANGKIIELLAAAPAQIPGTCSCRR